MCLEVFIGEISLDVGVLETCDDVLEISIGECFGFQTFSLYLFDVEFSAAVLITIGFKRKAIFSLLLFKKKNPLGYITL